MKRRAWLSLGLLIGSVVLYGGLTFARPLMRNGCICIRPNQVFKPLPESSLEEAIRRPPAKPCCTH